ncbi:hypothetical protein HPC49_39390 [Pyxidicoccus fallax]|uniref:Uncharacterized protein n=1 Tax=Pyxidicoccus fallax TaxID=394095 RepID=A0A848LEN6_9BACT|nr:competence protein ComJ [Pyxidicoccus fallax]NMO16864.1 hypothetical protein [Pyxidicoccus fallax]NPC84265.1 hypothetical protein [Pyxidicoccus fallax]
MEQKFDLLISHSQLRLRSKPYVDSEHQWGPGNAEQGFLLHDGLINADPLVEGSFGANVIVRVSETYTPDPAVQRSARLAFNIIEPDNVTVSSASEEFKVEFPFRAGPHTVVYDVCLANEVYYVFTILPTAGAESVMQLDDNWGASKDAPLRTGKF